jgi:predicted DNA-binding transcriptional regulator YafY
MSTADGVPLEYFEALAPKPLRFPVTIDVQADKARYLQEHKFSYGFVNEQPEKDHVRMFFEAPCLEAFSRWYITFADFATIVEPTSLKRLLKQRLEAVHQEIS